MYSVTKGTDSFALSTAHREVVNAVKEAGLHEVTLPGDGDVTLRSLQWGFYTCQRYNWFTELIVPIDLFMIPMGNIQYLVSKTLLMYSRNCATM